MVSGASGHNTSVPVAYFDVIRTALHYRYIAEYKPELITPDFTRI